MSYSISTTTASAGQTLVMVPFPYLSKPDVQLTINGELTNEYTWVGSNALELNTPLEGEELVTVSRVSPRDNPVVTFTPGTLVSKQLNKQVLQLLYTSQEAVDSVGNALTIDPRTDQFVAQARRVTQMLDPVGSQDAATKKYVDDKLFVVGLDEQYLPSAPLAAPVTARLMLEKDIMVQWFPVQPDNGSFNSYTGLQRALNAAAEDHKPLLVPAGAIYRTMQQLVVPSGVKIISNGGMILGHRPAALGRVLLLANGSSHIHLEGLHVRNNAVTGAGRSCVEHGSDVTDVKYKGCLFDQDPADGNTLPGDYECAGIRIQKPGNKRVTVDETNDFQYLKYGVLVSDPSGDKTGAWDAEDIWVENNIFDNIASEGVEINQPGLGHRVQRGSMKVNGNKIRVPMGITNIPATLASNALGIGCAGAVKFEVTGNTVKSRQQCIHFEDDTEGVIVTGNTLLGNGYRAANTIRFLAPNLIIDDAGGLLEWNFEAGELLLVSGAGVNNGYYSISELTDSVMTVNQTTITSAAAGPSVVLDGTEGVTTKSLLHLPAGTVDLSYASDGAKRLVCSDNILNGSKDKGISFSYGPNTQVKDSLIADNIITNCVGEAIGVFGNNEEIANITGNIIKRCGTAIALGGNGPGTLVDDNNISDCGVGLSFSDNKRGVILGLNPMRNVGVPYKFTGAVTMPVVHRRVERSFEATQPAGVTQYTPWSDAIDLGLFADGSMTLETVDLANNGSYGFSVWDVEWVGGVLTVTNRVSGQAGSHASVQTPQMDTIINGRMLQVRARIAGTTAARTLSFNVSFEGTIMQVQ